VSLLEYAPMRAVLAMLIVTLPAASGCGKKAREGLPPADRWDQVTAPGALAELEQPRGMERGGGHGGGRGGDPHAGVPGAPPLGDDPHAGMDVGGMGGMGGGGDPHAGLDMGGGGAGGVDVTQLGLPPPDPNRKIDPSRRVKGTIRLHPKVKDRVKSSVPVFLVIRRAGPDGQPTGSPLAVEKLVWAGGDALPFELTEANAMSGGTELAGDVVVMARYDQDSDAISKQPGDVTGQVRAKVPADKLELTLDTILP
jgi:predicted small lipoprotein YifL